MGGAAAPEEGATVELDLDTVDLDGTFDGRAGERQEAPLPSEANQEQVGPDGVAHQRTGEPSGVDEARQPGPGRVDDRLTQLAGGQVQVGRTGEVAGGRDLKVDDRRGDALAHGGDRVGARRHDDVASQHQPSCAGGDPRCADFVLGRRDLEEREDGTALLGQADHVERGDALALEMGGHAQEGRDGDHARTADAGDDDAVGTVQHRQRRLRQHRETGRRRRPSRGAAGRPLTVTKLGQNPLRQVKSLLQADWSIRRLRPNSVSTGWTARQLDCDAAVAAALAHQLVDHGALVGSGKTPRLRRRRFSAAQV